MKEEVEEMHIASGPRGPCVYSPCCVLMCEAHSILCHANPAAFLCCVGWCLLVSHALVFPPFPRFLLFHVLPSLLEWTIRGSNRG